MLSLSHMDINLTNIIPVTQARSRLGDLAEKVIGEDYVVLTKGGVPKAALVDVKYLFKLQKAVASIYKKTFIDPKLLKYTRLFSQSEIESWQKEDQL